MVSRSAAATSVLAWVLVVCVAAGVTWAVIDGAGGNLGTADEGSSVLAVPTTSDSPGLSPSKVPPEPKQPGVWHGPAGLLSVRCDGRRVRLESATPADGYGVEVDNNGTPELEAKFESATRELRVNVTCVDGQPVWSLSSHDD
jgi:hypothetical protein